MQDMADSSWEKQLRINFAARVRSLISSEPGAKRLESFSKKTGITMARLSEWQNLERIEWPSMRNFLRLCAKAGKSPNWFLSAEHPLEQLVREEKMGDAATAELIAMAEGIVARYGTGKNQQNEPAKTSSSRKGDQRTASSRKTRGSTAA